MTEGWKIALLVLGFTIILTIIMLFWPQIYAKLWGKHPDTIIYIGGYEHSYFIDELREQAPKRAKITYKPIKFPPGIDSMEGKDIPVIFKKWNYPEGSKLFHIRVLNDGKSKDEDILIDVSFPMNKTRILETEILNNDGNVKIVQGGSKNKFKGCI